MGQKSGPYSDHHGLRFLPASMKQRKNKNPKFPDELLSDNVFTFAFEVMKKYNDQRYGH